MEGAGVGVVVVAVRYVGYSCAMTWTAYYFDPRLNRDTASRAFGSKDDALRAACDLMRRGCPSAFHPGAGA
jgi:hypothetical protein